MSVTDHDTVAALGDVRRAADPLGITLVDGIEVTAVHEGRDVHVLGYFLDPGDASFGVFLHEQRLRRVERIREIGASHPGVTRQPAVMAALVGAGLDAIELYHPDHTPEMMRDLRQFAVEHGLLVTGGSDFHGDDSRGRPLGRSTLPTVEFERLTAARRRI
jgi:predicted metal-dependent phosphoesterase TrpH